MGGSGGRLPNGQQPRFPCRGRFLVNDAPGTAEAPAQGAGEDELRLVQYKAFLEQLTDRRKHLAKWLDGLKGLRETGIKQDRVTIANVEEAIAGGIAAHEGVKLKSQADLKEFVTNVGAGILPVLEKSIKDRRQVDKYFDQAVGKLTEMIVAGDAVTVEKCMELLTNIENSHAGELQRLKLQVADLLTGLQDLSAENDALMTGVAARAREIPDAAAGEIATVACPVCRSVHTVAPGTRKFECPICGAEINA